MKTLVVYYSRTNTTKKVAEDIQNSLHSDIEEIKEEKDYSGAIGFAKGALDSVRKKESEIKPMKHNPEDYDVVIIGTPVWASTMASPVYTYLNQNKKKFKNVSFFCTTGSSGYDSTISNMEKITSKKGLANFHMTKKDIKENYAEDIEIYIENLKNAILSLNKN